MWENYYDIDVNDHLLKFNGLELVEAYYEPVYENYENVEFGPDYFISKETGERIAVAHNYRGEKGTQDYQVDVTVAEKVIKTFTIQSTPNGEVLTAKK